MTQPPTGDWFTPSPGEPTPTPPAPAAPQPQLPGPQPHPPTPQPHPPTAQPGAGGRPPRRRALLVTSIVFAVVLLLCGSGGVTAFLLLRDAEAGEGAPEPVAAVDAFMRAVYADQDATEAAALVCSEARDETAISKKVAEVERYGTTYSSPQFHWSPPKIEERSDEAARVSTVLTMTTGDEKVAEQRLTFQVVNKTGWWVCEVGG